MTKHEMNLALAEWGGWEPSLEIHGCFRLHENGWTVAALPEYTKDLNAVHRLLAKLNQSQRVTYSNILAEVVETQFEKIFATAIQQCEALLRTLGLWKEKGSE